MDHRGHFRDLNWRYLPYVRPIFPAYVREYPSKIWPYMVQYLHFRILKISHWMEKPTWISETVRFCPKRGCIKSTSCHSRKRSNMLLVRNYWPPNMDGSMNPNGQFSSSSAPFSILIHSYLTDMFGPDIPRGRCLRAVRRFLRLRRHQCGGLLVLPPSGARTLTIFWWFSTIFQIFFGCVPISSRFLPPFLVLIDNVSFICDM